MSKPTLYLMAGYPGAGKTTVATMISELTGAVHISSDQTRFFLFPAPTFSQEEHDKLYEALDAKTRKLLEEGKSVIYDANLNRYEHRQQKYKICEEVDATAKLVWVQTPRLVARQRATGKDRLHYAPKEETLESLFDRIADVIEPPKNDESPIIIDGTHTNPDIIKQALGL